MSKRNTLTFFSIFKANPLAFQSTIVTLVMATVLLFSTSAFAAITVTPSTWNMIGLDSNSPAFGPYRFPVGAKVCGGTAGDVIPVNFTWDRTNPYVDLRSGSAGTLGNPMEVTLGSNGCADAFFEVEIDRNSAAFTDFATNLPARYHITAGGVSTPTPREIVVERLVSQSRNAITNMEFGTSLASMASVPNGGSMNLIVGNTYYIRMTGYTATQGYQQLESFVSFPNTIFQILSVDTTYSADTSPIVSSPNDQLYADACGWDNDPNSPSYMSCWVDGKAGGAITVTYQVEILSVGSGRESLNTLIHDFSGSSFHYNADFSTSTRFANLIDPTSISISKDFAPDPNNVGGVSSLTFRLTNPNYGSISGVSFIDDFPNTGSAPAAPGDMILADTIKTNTCGGTLSDAGGGVLNYGDDGISLTGATIPANSSCSVVVNVTTTALGIYNNTTDNVFVGTIDTGKFASDSLTVNTDPPPGTGVCNDPMASWLFTSGFTVTNPAPTTNNITTATASSGSGLNPASGNSRTADGTSAWLSNGSIDSSGTTLVTSNNDYFEFALNTTDYTSVDVSFYAKRSNNGPKGVAVYYSNTSGNPETNPTLYDSATALDGAGTGWLAFGAFTIPTSANPTYIRIYGYNAKNSSPGSDFYIDDVVFTGCKLPIPPTIAKSFTPTMIASTGTSTLSFTLTNPNAIQLTGAQFTDALPAGMTVASTPGASTTCTGSPTWAPTAGATSLTFGNPTGGTIPVSGSCTVQVDVTAATGTYSNTSGFLSTSEGGVNKNNIATATLTALAPPAMTKQFAPNPTIEGGTTTLTFQVTNPNASNALSLVAFSDTFPTAPGAMIVAPTPNDSTSGCGTPTFSPVSGSGSISFSGGTIAAGATCTVSVDITAPVLGSYGNTSGIVSHQLPAGTAWYGNFATDTLQVDPANPDIALLKQVSTVNAGPWSSYLATATGDNVYYKFTVENLGDVPLSSVDVTDPEPEINMASCIWNDGEGLLLSAPFDLPVADADNGHLATCVLGPITAALGSHENTATASGTFAATTVTDTSTATYATSALTLTKSAAEAYFLALDDILSYSYTISNTGSAILSGPLTIAVTDNKINAVTCPALTTVGNNNSDFEPGESLVCSASYTVTASDVSNKQVTNIARAKVGVVFTPIATATVPLGPDLSVVKTNSVGGTAATNIPFDWILTVTNQSSSGAAATFINGEVLLVDDLPSPGATYSVPAVATNSGGASGVISCAIASNTLTCSATGAVSIPPGGSFSIAVNTTADASVSPLVNPQGNCEVDPDNNVIEIIDTIDIPTNNTCSDSVDVVTPALTITKTASASYFISELDLPIDYTYTVTNTGGADIPGGVSVVDDKIVPASITCPAIAILNAGASVTCTASYSVTSADVTVREITNKATATVGAVSSPKVSLTIPIGPDLSVVKSSDVVGAATPGTPFNWTLAVTNAPTAGAPATFTDTLLLLTDELPNSGETYSVPATATNTGGSTGSVDCAIAADILSCTANGAVSIPPGGGFSIAVATTPTVVGTLLNPRGGIGVGVCQVDPGTLASETDESNNDCSDSVTVGLPSLTVTKMADQAKAPPGGLINYTVIIGNSGPVIAKDVKVEDFMGRFTALGLDPYGNGTPFHLTPETSGLIIQTIEYSNDTDDSDGITYGYVPSDPSGFDSDVTYWRIFMGGDMQANPSQFTLRYQAQVE